MRKIYKLTVHMPFKCYTEWVIVYFLSFIFRWFVGRISRKESERQLLSPENGLGSYLIRESETAPGLYQGQIIVCTITSLILLQFQPYCAKSNIPHKNNTYSNVKKISTKFQNLIFINLFSKRKLCALCPKLPRRKR